MNEELAEIVQEIEEYEILNPDKIDIELYDINKTTLQSQLLINTDVNFNYVMENRTYEYRFVEPIYIQSILIKSKANDLKGMTVIVIDIENNEILFSIENYTKYIYPQVNVKNIIKSFKITPPKRAKKDPKINLEKIEVYGYKISKYDEFKNHVNLLEKLSKSLKSEVKKTLEDNQKLSLEITTEKNTLEAKHEELDDEVETLMKKTVTLTRKQEEIEKELTQKKQSLDDLTTNAAKTKATIEEFRKQDQILKDSIQQKEATSQSLNTKISKEQAELKKLESDSSLIAYDIQSYVKNANKDIKVYLLLAGIPWVLIALVTGFILWGSADLTTVLKVEEKAQIWTIFWSRIPFVIAVGTVLFVSYEISNIFVRRIIDIHQQKLDFAKIGIIAKDVSDASMDGLELSDKEKFELRTKLKMDMLKSHLSRELGKKYETKINPNILVRYGDMLTLKKKEKISTRDSEDLIAKEE